MAGQIVHRHQHEARDRRVLPRNEIDVRSDGAREEKAATFAGLIVIAAFTIGVMPTGSILMVLRGGGAEMAILLALHRFAANAERQYGRWRRQAQRVKHDKKTCRAPTPFPGQKAQHLHNRQRFCAVRQDRSS